MRSKLRKEFDADFLRNFPPINVKCDDGVTVVHVPTPKGWKCKRKGCKDDFKHGHSIYPSLNAK